MQSRDQGHQIQQSLLQSITVKTDVADQFRTAPDGWYLWEGDSGALQS